MLNLFVWIEIYFISLHDSFISFMYNQRTEVNNNVFFLRCHVPWNVDDCHAYYILLLAHTTCSNWSAIKSVHCGKFSSFVRSQYFEYSSIQLHFKCLDFIPDRCSQLKFAWLFKISFFCCFISKNRFKYWVNQHPSYFKRPILSNI